MAPSKRLALEAPIDTTTPTTSTNYERHTYYGTLQDNQAIATIRTKFGLASDSEAIRFALRLVAEGALHIKIDPHQLPRGYQAR